MARALLLVTGLFVTVSPLAGCSAWFRQPANVEATRADVEALRRDQAELLTLIRELRARLELQSESISALRADSNLQLRQLDDQINMLIAQFEEQGMRFERMQRSSPPTFSAPPDTSGGTGGRAPSSAASLFEAAQRDFNRGNYQLAIAGFNDYLTLSPDSESSDDAQYWKGESYYSLGDMEKAIQEFLKVRDIYPDGDKVALATLKIGYSFLRQGDEATAGRYFETVIREFPNSPEAPLAKDKLDELH